MAWSIVLYYRYSSHRSMLMSKRKQHTWKQRDRFLQQYNIITFKKNFERRGLSNDVKRKTLRYEANMKKKEMALNYSKGIVSIYTVEELHISAHNSSNSKDMT